MERTIVRERIIPRDPRLGRNVHHDSQSRRFRVPPRRVPLHSIKHESGIGILDQGNLGACTGYSGIACLARGQFFPTITPSDPYQLDSAGAIRLYSKSTEIDPFAGTYPPDDTGSDGLSIAKALKAVGEISGYLWAFTLDEALGQLMQQPLITGIPWRESMYLPDAGGLVIPSGPVLGGHEIAVDEYREDRGWVGFTNSWGPGFGLSGRFYLEAEAWGDLLNDQGDVTAFVPSTEPEPDPIPDPDREFAAILKPWARGNPFFHRKIATAGQRWLTAKGL